MLFELLRWWYGSGWLRAWQGVPGSVKKVEQTFSMPVLFRNLFAPWKQVTTMPGDKSIGAHFRAAIDNLVSRTVGFCVRLLTLIVAAATLTVYATFGLISALAWPLLPIALIYCLVRAILG